MKYTQPDRLNDTNCKNCIFATYDGITQTGCMHGRIDKFQPNVIEAYDNDKEFFVIKRICNTFRNKSWNNGIPDLIKSREESCISFDLLIDINDVDEEKYQIIKQNIDQIAFPRTKYNIVFFCDNKLTEEQKSISKKLYQEFLPCTLSIYAFRDDYIKYILEKSKKSFHAILNSDTINNVGKTMQYIEKLINEDLERALIVVHKNQNFISNLVFKLMSNCIYEDKKTMKNFIKRAKSENMYFEYLYEEEKNS